MSESAITAVTSLAHFGRLRWDPHQRLRNLSNNAELVVGATLNPLTPTDVPVTSGNVTITHVGVHPTFTIMAAGSVSLSTLTVDSASTDPLLVLYVPPTGPAGSIAIARA